jgi:uncharacterized protein (TIGR00255 family)
MIKSMTGYGKGEAISERGRCTVEIRSVNHRYSELSVKAPRGFISMEQEVKKIVSSFLKRGKIDVFVQWEEASSANSIPGIDTQAAEGYFAAFAKLSHDLGIGAEVPLSLILAQKGVLMENIATIDEEESLPLIAGATEMAVGAIDAMRIREGESLSKDMLARREQVAKWTAKIGERSPLVVMEYQQKLKARLEQLLAGVEMDAARLAQEVALMADRSDVTEELVRLSSHFGQFDEALQLSEPVGRKLDFLMQEMNREVNTIGSKSSDAEITTLVVLIKAEMEKMREQVQNVE